MKGTFGLGCLLFVNASPVLAEAPKEQQAILEAVISQRWSSSEWHSISVQIQDLPQTVVVRLGDDPVVKFVITPIMKCMAMVEMEAASWRSRTPDRWPAEVVPGSILRVDEGIGHHLFEVKVEFTGYGSCHKEAPDT